MFEEKYAGLFPSPTGNVAKSLQMSLGELIIQVGFQYSERELVEQITENPYLQYFIGLPGYQEEAPFDPSTLVDFRKRITAEMLMEANEYMLAHKDDSGKDDMAAHRHHLGRVCPEQTVRRKGRTRVRSSWMPPVRL